MGGRQESGHGLSAPAWRDRAAARLGNGWRGLYSLVMPPLGMRYITPILIVYVMFAYWLHPRWIGVLALPM